MFKSLGAQLTPDNEGVLVEFMVWLFGINWKTSLSGFLSFGIAISAPLTGFTGALAVIMPGKWPIALPIATLTISTLAGIGKAWVGLISKDAGTQQVQLPTVADPVGVPSHEVPNQPLPAGAKVVQEP